MFLGKLASWLGRRKHEDNEHSCGASVPTLSASARLAQSRTAADDAVSGLRVQHDRLMAVRTLHTPAVARRPVKAVGSALDVPPGTAVRHRYDTRWCGTVLGESTQAPSADGIWLLVQWLIPERFVGLSQPQDLTVKAQWRRTTYGWAFDHLGGTINVGQTGHGDWGVTQVPPALHPVGEVYGFTTRRQAQRWVEGLFKEAPDGS